MTVASDPRRGCPRTDTVLADPRSPRPRRLGRELVKEAVGGQQQVRVGARARAGVVDAVLDALPATATTLRPVLNAAGVVVHTNLGRAPLCPRPSTPSSPPGTVDLELDLHTGGRGSRGSHGPLLADATGAEDAMVVNNCAAALAARAALARREWLSAVAS